MDTYDLVSKHPLLAILRNVPLEKTIDYAEAAVQGGAPFFEVALNSPHALEQITMLRTISGTVAPWVPAPPSPWSAAKPLWTPVHSSF